jgi:type IV pilus assembly protein PilA
MHKIRKGFSLVELVVVLAVIGLIAAIAVPSFSAVRDGAAQRAAEASAASIESNAIALAVLYDTDGGNANGVVDGDEWSRGLVDALAEVGVDETGPLADTYTYTHPNGKQADIVNPFAAPSAE